MKDANIKPATYLPVELEIIMFDSVDVILTSAVPDPNEDENW